MTGTKRSRIVLQPRDLHLFREMDTMRVIDREQAKLVAGFRSTTRANARLLVLSRAGLLRRIFVGTIVGGRKALYLLTATAAAKILARLPVLTIRQDQAMVGTPFLEHQLKVNSIFLTVKYRPIARDIRFRRWIAFHRSLNAASALIPDGYFEVDARGSICPIFVEVDLGTEDARVWRKKTAGYLRLALSGDFERLFGQPRFAVIVAATSDRRLRSIRAAVAKSTNKLFWFSTFDIIQRDGFWSPVWLRPTSDDRQSLV